MANNQHVEALNKTLNTKFSISSSTINSQNSQTKEMANSNPTAPLVMNSVSVKSLSNNNLNSSQNLTPTRNASKNKGEMMAAYRTIVSPLLTPDDRSSSKDNESFTSSSSRLRTPEGFSNFNQQAYVKHMHQKAKQPKHNQIPKHSLSSSVFNYPYYTFVMPESCFDEHDIEHGKQNFAEPISVQSQRKQLKSLSPISPPNSLFHFENGKVPTISSPSLSPVSNVSSRQKSHSITEHVDQRNVCGHRICDCSSPSNATSIPMLSVNVEDDEGITTTVNIGLSFSKPTIKRPIRMKPSRIDFNGKQIWCQENY